MITEAKRCRIYASGEKDKLLEKRMKASMKVGVNMAEKLVRRNSKCREKTGAERTEEGAKDWR